MRKDALLLIPSEAASGSFSFDSKVFADSLRPGAYRLETVLYGWNQPFDNTQLSELAEMGAPFLIGESTATLPIELRGQTSRPLRQRISNADPKQYRAVNNEKDWKNPFLIVLPDGLKVLGVSGTEKPISVDSVAPVLEGLPDSAWPYGLVVAVEDNGIISSKQDVMLIDANRRQLLRLLRNLGIAVNLFPSA